MPQQAEPTENWSDETSKENKSGRTFCTRARVLASVMAGEVLGIAHTMVTPPARAAAVPEEKSSLCVAPGSRRWTCTSIRPENRSQKQRLQLIFEYIFNQIGSTITYTLLSYRSHSGFDHMLDITFPRNITWLYSSLIPVKKNSVLYKTSLKGCLFMGSAVNLFPATDDYKNQAPTILQNKAPHQVTHQVDGPASGKSCCRRESSQVESYQSDGEPENTSIHIYSCAHM